MKFTLTILMLCALGCAQAQLNAGPAAAPGSLAGMPSGQFFQNVVLQSEAHKLLIRPDLPADLRQRVLDVMANAEQGFNSCQTASAILPWMQMRCSALQLKISKNELKAIESEGKARAQTASMVALLQTPTPVAAAAAAAPAGIA